MKGKLILLIMSIVLLTSCSKDKGEEELQAKVDFSYVVDIATKTVTFTDKSVAVENYNWFFAEGETSTEKSPKHTFKSEGTFKVVLTAKAIGSKEVLFKRETIVIGNANGHKPMAVVQDAEDIDFAGFKIKWTRTNPDTRAILNLQIATDADFVDILTTQRVDHFTENLEFKANDLDVSTQYWFRMQIKYTETSIEDVYYSAVKTATTKAMPAPSFTVTRKTDDNKESRDFAIVFNNISSQYFFSKSPTYDLKVSTSKTFEQGHDAIIASGKFYTYLKEPSTTFYIKYTATYGGVSKTFTAQESYTFKHIEYINNVTHTGDYSKMFKKNGKTMLEFGVKDGARSVIQISGFTGVGKYPLKYNTNYNKEAANTINTVDDSYAYYFDGTSPFKYYLSRQGVSLNVYRETATAYYCTIISTDDYNTLQFKQSKLEVRNGDYYQIHTPYFVVLK
ncbi:MAG: PKD domain-containing protein [Marinifilaceae bacterium]